MAVSTGRKQDRPAPAMSAEQVKEELSFLRQKIRSLSMRGHYRECFKLIEDNLRFLYFQERWPEHFHSNLLIHKRCYPSMDVSTPYEEYLRALLKKNGIPAAFASLLRTGADPIIWETGAFRDMALAGEEKGEYDSALGYIEIALKIDPLASGLYLLKGRMLQKTGRDDEALACFEHALEINPTDYQASGALAELYLKRDPGRALEQVKSAVEQYPADAKLRALQARILLRLGEFQSAAEAYDLAISLDPLAAEYRYEKAELLLARQQIMGAIRQYEKAVDLDASHIPSRMRLAGLLEQTRPELALPHVNAVAARQPQNREAALLKARLLDRTGEPLHAIRQYRALLQLDENCAEAYGALGRLYLPDDAERSLQNYDKAAALEPRNPDYQLGKAQAHEKLGQAQQAIGAYKAAAALDKSNPKPYAALGDFFRETNPKQALGYYAKAIRLRPDYAYYHQARGELLMAAPGHGGEALECFQTAVAHDPANAALHVRLGHLLEQMGNHASALEHYKKAIRLDDGLTGAHHGLARLLTSSEPDTALAHINRALELDATRGEYYFAKARILEALLCKREALDRLMESLRSDGTDGETLRELGLLLGEDGLRVALMYINRAVEMVPNNAEYHLTRAGLLFRLGDKGRSLGEYRKALELDPASHEAMFGMARALDAQGDKQAPEYFERACAAAPDKPTYHAHRADCLAKDPLQYEQALESYDRAILLDKRAWEVILAKARLLDRRGDRFAAMDEYRRVLLIRDDCLEATARMGVLLVDLGARAALNYFDRAARLDPENYEYHAWRGRLLTELGDAPGAGEAYRLAVELGGESGALYATLAQAVQGRAPETALEHCRRAMELEPDRAEHRLLCGDIYAALGQPDTAKDCYVKALELDPKCHRAQAKTAGLLFGERDPACLEWIDRALEQVPEEAEYHYSKALMLDLIGDAEQAAASVLAAVKRRPNSLVYRETLVALLRKKGARLQYFLERRKYKQLLRKEIQARAAQLEAAAGER